MRPGVQCIATPKGMPSVLHEACYSLIALG